MKKERWKDAATFLAATFDMTWNLWLSAYVKLAPNSAYLVTFGTMAPFCNAISLS